MRKLDDIIPPSRRRDMDQQQFNESPSERGRQPLRLSPRSPKFPYTTLIGFTIVIAISIGALFYFSGAKVEITPNSASAIVQGSFTATRSSGDLPFEVISTKKVASQTVQGTGNKKVSSIASGIVTVYNTQSKVQRLVTKTRFANTAGLVFRIRKSIKVPAGTTSKPGSTRITVYADQPSSIYNIGPSSFTLPGLAGTSLASKVYARSTESMTGGASGNIPTMSSSAEKNAVTALMTALSSDLGKSIQSQVPVGYVLLSGAIRTTYKELTPVPSSTTGMVDVKEEGTVTAVVFPSAALAKAIASSVSALDYQGNPVTLDTTTGLTLASVSGIPNSSDTNFNFTLSGTTSILYTVNAPRIAAAVAGKTRAEAEVVLTNYPEVKRAVLILRPFWKKTFPKDPSSITISVLPATSQN